MNSFVSERYQKGHLNGKSSDWTSITAGVPQGSLLSPLLFWSHFSRLRKFVFQKVNRQPDPLINFKNSPIKITSS